MSRLMCECPRALSFRCWADAMGAACQVCAVCLALSRALSLLYIPLDAGVMLCAPRGKVEL